MLLEGHQMRDFASLPLRILYQRPGRVIHRLPNVYLAIRGAWDAFGMKFWWIRLFLATGATLVWLVLAPQASVSAPIPANPAWQLPLAAPIELINQYRQPNSDYSAGHRGVDYQVSLGQAIFAPADGVVYFAGLVVNRSLISIKHGSAISTEFEPACAVVGAGQAVQRGQIVAKVCDGKPNYRQHCFAMRCLHFAMKIEGKYLSPLALIGRMNPSRLLPNAG
jgi:murein DD-endopeptidase MepM/ murein hydrolase activator NlpD